MRVLFSAVAAFGHVVPLLPLARAARDAGHDVALMTHPSMASAAPSMPLLPVGLDMAEDLVEVSRRTGGDPLTDKAAFAVEFFVENPPPFPGKGGPSDPAGLHPSASG